MPHLEENNMCRLFLLLVNVATDVFQKLFKVLVLKGNSLEDYLKTFKHDFYHLYQNTLCCQCSETCKTSVSLPIRSKRIFTKEQFCLLFKSNTTKNKSHLNKKEICICDLIPIQNIKVEAMDITLIYHILKHHKTLQTTTEHWLDTVKRIRNQIVHESDFKKLTIQEFESRWQTLVGALRGLASTISVDYEVGTLAMVYSVKNMEINDNHSIEKFKLMKDWYFESMAVEKQLQEEAGHDFVATLRGVEDRLSSKMVNMEDIQKTMETVLGHVLMEINTKTVISKKNDEIEEVSCYSGNDDHSHCNTCIKLFCNNKDGILHGCEFVDCTNGCKAKLHMCKLESHKNVCSKETIPCVNENCSERLERSKLSVHLRLFCSSMPSPRQHNGTCDECISNLICNKGMKYEIEGNLMPCPNRCQLNILTWEFDEHKETCSEQKISCYNRQHGCLQILKRSKMKIHLPICPSMSSAKPHTGECPDCETALTCKKGMEYAINGNLVPCPNRCQLNILTWNSDEHRETCPEQKISCYNRQHGCLQILTRSQMKIHLPICPSMPLAKPHSGVCPDCETALTCKKGMEYPIKGNFMPCPNRCQLNILTWNFDDHQEICPEQKLHCYNCSLILTRSQMLIHLPVCPSMPSAKPHTGKCLDCETTLICKKGMKHPIRGNSMPCPNRCNLIIQTWDLDDHKEICPEQKIPCYNRESGCLQILTRSTMAIHLSVCPIMMSSRQQHKNFNESESSPIQSRQKGNCIIL